MTRISRFQDLIDTFHSLRERRVIGVEECEAIAKNASSSSGTAAAAQFIVSLWHRDARFNLAKAWGIWDTDHRNAWKAWAADPWWP